MKITLSKSQWQLIGQKTGWLKNAYHNHPEEVIIGFPPTSIPTKGNKCSLCGKEVKPNSFSDQLSKQEWEISHMCQECQNKMSVEA